MKITIRLHKLCIAIIVALIYLHYIEHTWLIPPGAEISLWVGGTVFGGLLELLEVFEWVTSR